jgi:hypothetical protein
MPTKVLYSILITFSPSNHNFIFGEVPRYEFVSIIRSSKLCSQTLPMSVEALGRGIKFHAHIKKVNVTILYVLKFIRFVGTSRETEVVGRMCGSRIAQTVRCSSRSVYGGQLLILHHPRVWWVHSSQCKQSPVQIPPYVLWERTHKETSVL